MLKTFDFDKTPIVEIVNEILVDSSRRGASDIHFDPHDKFVKVRIRIDGELSDYSEIPEAVAKNLVTRLKIISGMNITESRLPQDGAIKATIEDIDLDLRVSSLPTSLGEKIVIRLLDYSLSNAGLETLGFNDENYKKVVKMIGSPNGIILITGATGTGKSTTVYSILQRLNKENTNIITVEDPIEMDIDGINQIQTNSEIGLDFATVLRSILRQDPNIIMIGEIRDTETAKIAVRASITGHLVLSTIHTNDSLNTIERLLDMDVERYLLASSLTGIISQKLARKLCPNCKKLRPTNDYEKKIFKRVFDKDVNEIYSADGCDQCKNGYNGRIAIHEVLVINQEIRDAISSNIPKEKLRHLVYSSDVISMLQDGMNKVLEGETTLEEILKIIELDDDGNGVTGLKTALETTEIAQESDTNNNNINTNKEIVTKNNDSNTISNVIQTNINENDNEVTKEVSNSNINNQTLDSIDDALFGNLNIDNTKSTNNIENKIAEEQNHNSTIEYADDLSFLNSNTNNLDTENNIENNQILESAKSSEKEKIIPKKNSLFGSKRNIFK